MKPYYYAVRHNVDGIVHYNLRKNSGDPQSPLDIHMAFLTKVDHVNVIDMVNLLNAGCGFVRPDDVDAVSYAIED